MGVDCNRVTEYLKQAISKQNDVISLLTREHRSKQVSNKKTLVETR